MPTPQPSKDVREYCFVFSELFNKLMLTFVCPLHLQPTKMPSKAPTPSPTKRPTLVSIDR